MTFIRVCLAVAVSLLALRPTLAAADQAITDGSGRPIRLIADDGTVVEFIYDDQGRLIRTEDNKGRIVIFYYDENGKPLKSEVAHE